MSVAIIFLLAGLYTSRRDTFDASPAFRGRYCNADSFKLYVSTNQLFLISTKTCLAPFVAKHVTKLKSGADMQ